MNPNDDTALVMRAWRGDEGAIDDLGRRHGPALHALIVAQGGEQGANETLDAMLEKARTQIRQCETPADAGLWLAGLVRDFAPKRGAGTKGGMLARIRGLPPGPREALMLRLVAGLPAWDAALYVGGTTEDVRADLERGAEMVVGRSLDAAARDYLEDPGQEPVEAIRALEKAVVHHAYVPKKAPTELPWRKLFAGVAVLLVAAAVAFFLMKPEADPDGWLVVWTYGAEGSERLRPGEWFETGEGRRARLTVDALGHVDLEPNSRVAVMESDGTTQRVKLERGALEATIRGRPRSFAIQTPAGTVVDLGCAFFLEIDEEGHGKVRVTEGSVEIHDPRGHRAFVPAGAAVELGPEDGIPYFEDAPEALHGVAAVSEQALVAAMSAVHPSDSLTLFHLLGRVDDEARGLLIVRLQELVPLPEGVDEEDVLALEPSALAAWEARLREEW